MLTGQEIVSFIFKIFLDFYCLTVGNNNVQKDNNMCEFHLKEKKEYFSIFEYLKRLLKFNF